MLNRHFFKTLLIFSGMIVLGLVAISYALSLDQKTAEKTDRPAQRLQK